MAASPSVVGALVPAGLVPAPSSKIPPIPFLRRIHESGFPCKSSAAPELRLGLKWIAVASLLFSMLRACTITQPSAPMAPGQQRDAPLTPAARPSVAAPVTPGERAATSRWLAAASPELRRLTVVVHVKPPDELAKHYRSLAIHYPALQRFMLGHADGSFGSGFVMLLGPGPNHPRHQLFVVTNQHVVGLADRAEVEFADQERRPGSVVYVDDAYDLAVIDLGEPTADVRGGFDLESSPPKDQDAVIAAGYPGLGDQPSYQVTKGYVSNQRLLLPHDEGERPYIQHTAPIDPGSSGGPLTNERGKLVGMNTLKIWDREGVGLAVPADAIAAALHEVVLDLDQPPLALDPDAMLEACREIVAELRDGKDGERLERNISARMAAKHGAASLGALAFEAEPWEPRFLNSPDRVYVHAIALRLRRQIPTEQASEAECSLPAGDRAAGAQVMLRVGQREYLLEFVTEQGRHKLTDAPLGPAGKRSFLERHQKRGPHRQWKPSLR